MTSPARIKDLADVLELIKMMKLPEAFAERLNPYVRDKFRELWNDAKAAEEFESLQQRDSGSDKGSAGDTIPRPENAP
jgi:hypothetical protein